MRGSSGEIARSGRPGAAHAGRFWRGAQALGAALLLALGACSASDARGRSPAGGCAPACGGLACGAADGCGGSCAPGSGCTPGAAGHVVEGAPTLGALDVAGQRYRVRGALSHGASRTLQSSSYRIEQGTLR